jgi:hypothetical protein
MRMGAKQLVEQAVHELFDRRDVTAVGRYWWPGYVEHSILGADRLEGLRDVAGSLPEGFRQHNPQIAEGASGLGRAIQTGRFTGRQAGGALGCGVHETGGTRA